MPVYVYIIFGVAGLILTGAGILINKIWRDSENTNQMMRESLLQLNTQTNESNSRLTEQITRLGNAVSGLNATVMAQADSHADFKISCSEHKLTINHRLNSHSEVLKKHGEDIAVIKGKINIK